jgi:hypothetical protein
VIPARLTVLPTIVHAYELDASGNRESKQGWEDQMAFYITPEVERLAVRDGARLFRTADVHLCMPLYAKLWRWLESASMEIAVQKTGRADFRMYSVGNWRYRGDLAPLRAALGSDFLLIAQFRNTCGDSLSEGTFLIPRRQRDACAERPKVYTTP